MVYRKYREWAQWGKMNTQIFKMMYRARKLRRLPPTIPLPQELVDKGVVVHDPNDADFPRKTRPDAVVVKRPALYARPPSENPFYKDEPCLLFDGSEAMSDGMNQALRLTKAVPRIGLPKALTDAAAAVQLPANHADMLGRAIMHSQVWDAVLERLPNRHDPDLFWMTYPIVFGIPQRRKNGILLDELYRYALSLGGEATTRLRNVRGAPISAVVRRGETLLCLRQRPHMTLADGRPLAALAGEDDVLATADEPFVDIQPIPVCIDLPPEHIYRLDTVMPRIGRNEVRTVLCDWEHDQKYPRTVKELLANAVIHCFGAALAVATSRYGTELTGRLPQPVTTQAVQVCDGAFDMVVFQLNTLDLASDDGVRNIVWLTGGQKFFKHVPFWDEFKQVNELNPVVFQNLLALLHHPADSSS